MFDVLEVQVHIHKRKSEQKIFRIIKSNPDIVGDMKKEHMTDGELRELIQESLKFMP